MLKKVLVLTHKQLTLLPKSGRCYWRWGGGLAKITPPQHRLATKNSPGGTFGRMFLVLTRGKLMRKELKRG